MVSDRVGDFIIRLQNAAMIAKREVVTPYSNHLEAIATKLRELGYLDSVDVKEKEGAKRSLVVTLRYNEQGKPKLRGVKRVSTPGRRLYATSAEAHKVKGGTGSRVLSTSVGILTDSQARKQHVGGEALFDIW